MATLAASVRIPIAALRAAPQRPTADGQVLLALLEASSGAALGPFIDLLNGELRQRGATLPSGQVSQYLRLIAHLQERLEAAELTADPQRQEGVKRAAKTFAGKRPASRQ